MDLRGILRRTAMQRPAVLAIALPGATEVRMAVEAGVRRQGWPMAGAPAAADLLVVCGFPEPGDAEWLDGIERSMPEPALRILVQETEQVAHALDIARRDLADRAVSPGEADAGDQQEVVRGETGGHRIDHEAHSGHMDHMGHDMHAMGEVAGLPMAERGDDRDELRLDQLHVPIGPGLTDWPAGLILRLTLQGDVVQGVDVDHLPVPSGPRLPFWDEPWLWAAQGEEITRGSAARRRCASHLDSAGRLLAVVGWDDAAARCRRLRDELLSGASREKISADLRGALRRVERSRTLRWSIAGLGELSSSRARAAGVTGPALAADGDAYDRLRMWLGEIGRGVEGLDDERPLTPDELTGPRGRLDGAPPPSRALLDILPELLTGAEFACARIIVASLDPDIEELAPVSGAAHV
ncbi:hypothetical protein CLM62_44855 [Streptomyces sp. SA15]|uniref:hypothetical protein n=1 Tax=Streptomyces sp. SA15 TaxID=934019 RepID=UPI000BAFD147|nr:hypothetical protein [Streptomyces sp. SA15]PAZ09625.1 hypothetical protein CLM62_44855 [Streptomyces sp. SA15]